MRTKGLVLNAWTLLSWQPRPKGATSPATSTTKANAATVPHMNGNAVGAEPINTATPTTKAIPARMKTSHVTSLRVHASEFAPDPTDLFPLRGTLTFARGRSPEAQLAARRP
jgi:hypothetical protein